MPPREGLAEKSCKEQKKLNPPVTVQHLLRQMGEDHPLGGLHKNGKNIGVFQGLCSQARAIPLRARGGVNTALHRAHFTHANMFSRVAQAELTLRSSHRFCCLGHLFRAFGSKPREEVAAFCVARVFLRELVQFVGFSSIIQWAKRMARTAGGKTTAESTTMTTVALGGTRAKAKRRSNGCAHVATPRAHRQNGL